ncbi:hypothetical protein AGLY_004757 [Aphis glycines]|uniref:Uncharacterized protein n=1 Tax=Aphis glycines TaxID=307491 RepID=A0A6G0TUS0_APHGL|nr:hypothetical protein AGLY_004757 [Aphis glycines]
MYSNTDVCTFVTLGFVNIMIKREMIKFEHIKLNIIFRLPYHPQIQALPSTNDHSPASQIDRLLQTYCYPILSGYLLNFLLSNHYLLVIDKVRILKLDKELKNTRFVVKWLTLCCTLGTVCGLPLYYIGVLILNPMIVVDKKVGLCFNGLNTPKCKFFYNYCKPAIKFSTLSYLYKLLYKF